VGNIIIGLAMAALAALCAWPVRAQAPSGLDALSRASAATVGVRVKAADGARSAATLGAERAGSGVVIGADGLVLTIGYLILEAQDIRIITQEGKVLPAVSVAYDLATGFGLVRPVLPWREAPVAPLGSDAALQTGQALMAAVGATDSGSESDVSLTQLVSKRAFSGTWEYHIDSALFTSPPVLAGRGNHSGAGLFNQAGELVGIGSLLVMDAAGLNRRMPGNMFVPVDLLKPILAEMQKSGSSSLSQRPWLGLTSTDQGGRVQVLRVNEDSPAQVAGLKAGDVVLAVDDKRVASLEDFYKKLWARDTPDTLVRLTVLQGADIKTLEVRPQNRMQTLRKPAGI
jgi:S1-C subfamily serine protease